MKKYFLLATFSLLTWQASRAQELNCVVKVNAKQIVGTQTRVFETLEKAIYQFMNNTRWTSDQYKVEERVECQILINLNERVSQNRFKGTIQVSSRRPVYNASIYSTMFNYQDENLEFNYVEFTPLEFNINSDLNNLTSVLAFYAYMILGLDYDSFSLKGGTTHFQNAQKVVGNAQSSQFQGWKAFESDRNRYWMVENILNDFYSPVRTCLYDYHLNGMDVLVSDVDAGRQKVLASLSSLERIHNSRPSSFVMQYFFNAKSDEIINLFSEAPAPEQQQVKRLLIKIDPGNSSKYENIGKR